MEDVTVELPDDLARWLRDRATKSECSMSEWAVEYVSKIRCQDKEYQTAMNRYLAMKPRNIDWPEGHKPTREELYDRILHGKEKNND